MSETDMDEAPAQANSPPTDTRDVTVDRVSTILPGPDTEDGSHSSPLVAEEEHTFAEDADEATRLAALAAGVRDQDDLERDIGRQADALLLEQANERDKKRLEKTLTDKDRLSGQIRKLETKLTQFGNQATKNKYRAEIQHYNGLIAELDKDLEQIQARIDGRQKDSQPAEDGAETLLEEAGSKRQPGESKRDHLIRTGKITPFSSLGRQLLRTSSTLADVMLDAEEEGEGEEAAATEDAVVDTGPQSHRNLLMPGFADGGPDETSTVSDVGSERPAKRRRLQSRESDYISSDVEVSSPPGDSDGEFRLDLNDKELAAIGHSGDEGEPQDDDAEGDFPMDTPAPKQKARKGKQKARIDATAESTQEDLTGIDDGDEKVYQARLQSWVRRRKAARQKYLRGQVSTATQQTAADDERTLDDMATTVASHEASDKDEVEDEWHLPHPTRTDTEFEDGYRIPGDIYPSLFDYQKTGVQWLWELYSQQVGGIIGDEMGLGKTIQVISFLAGLHYSKKLTKPIIVVTPATVMKQWVNEFHRWWPPLRVSILHTSGSGMIDIRSERRMEDDLESYGWETVRKPRSKGEKAAKRIVDRVIKDGHVLVTTYSGLQTYADLLIPVDWEYAVLDEGHKIRNPNTAITIYCKELRTHNRVILSGTPMQNNLTELWSLFDFVFPMRLGTLVNFRQQFEFPIKQGGYANASNLQVETAMKCAETLKDTISPYLLQRFKIDVAADLPKKSERVLFCKLTKLQRDAYETFLNSDDMRGILNGKRQALYGIDILRKICNHPDLVEHRTLSIKAGYAY
ncbi:DNA repair protein rhp26, partial [Elasticomyces elasticus]